MKYFIPFLFFCFTTIATYAQTINCKQHFANNYRSINDNQRSIASQNFNVTFYKCYFENTPNVRNIKGYVLTKFKMLTSATSITFDLKSNLTVDSVKYRNTISTFSRAGDAVQVNFPSTVAANSMDSVTIYYQGAPLTTDGYFATGLHSGAPITYTLSEPYGARYWFPCKDDVVDKADSIDVVLKYPNAYIGVANGVLASEINDGTFKTSTWKHRKPIAAYLIAIAITNYTKDIRSLTSNGNPMPFINYYYPESATSYNSSVASLVTAFGIFEQKFGAYPFNNELYSQTQIQNGVGGMEHQTNTFVDSWGAGLGAHELMHQWFGDKVTCNTWKDIWLNEGFASYGEVIYKEGTTGTAAMIAEMKSRATNINASSSGSVYCNDTTTVNSIFNYRLSYLKASYVIHMLRWQLGDLAFYQSCRNYLNAPGVSYGFATTDTLKKYMEQGLTGGGNLNEFFNDWVYGQGYPTYNIGWNQVGSNVIIKANQVSANAAVSFYEMPIPVRLIGATKDTVVRLNHTSNNQLFNFPLSFSIVSAQFDPEAWILSKGNTATQDVTLTPTAINNIIIDNSITIGPIPAKDILYIYKPANRVIKSIDVLNMQGQVLFSVNGAARSINVEHLPKGKYTLKLKVLQGKVVVKSFVK
jgi:aminopeptidase N